MLQVTDLHKTYGEKDNSYEALRGVSFEIKKGESIAIIGKSGSGKSTLMHLLAGLDTPTQGSIKIEGEKYSGLSESQLATLRNKRFGFVFQQFFLQPNTTVLDNVLLPLKIAKESAKTSNRKAIQVINEVGLGSKTDKVAKTLSGGEKQRVAIARALVTSPDVVFADEPTGNLDTENSKAVLNVMFNLHKKFGNTLIIVTHDNDIAKMCDRIIRIKDGQIEK